MKTSYLKESFKRPYAWLIVLTVFAVRWVIKKQDIDFFSQFWAILFLILLAFCLLRENNKVIKKLKYKTGKRLTL